MIGMVNEIESGRSIDAGDENKAPPANIESGSSVHNVQGAEIYCFPEEKFADIDHLESDGDDHGIRNSIEFVLLGGVREEDQRPAHHSETAIGKHLHIPSKDARIEFCAPVEIEKGIACDATIAARRCENPFQI